MKAAFLVFLLGAQFAHADMMKPATLDIICKGANDVRSFRVVSNANGAAIALNGTKVWQTADQLIAGTEGGPAYVQAVGGGYNITISGGDFDKAFNASSTIRNGKAPASIWDKTNRTVRALCTGLYSF